MKDYKLMQKGWTKEQIIRYKEMLKSSKIFNNKTMFDEYGIAINSEESYQGTAESLAKTGSVIFAWTDGKGTQYDFFMGLPNYRTANAVNIQGGVNNVRGNLYVAIMRKGAFGFHVEENPDASASYYEEKLGISDGEAVADLINGVRNQIALKK